MASIQIPFLTDEQYLALDRAAETRSEYHDGQMFALAGGSDIHSTIKVNLYVQFAIVLRPRGCRVNDSDLRLRIRQAGSYVYPDMSVYCSENKLSAPGTNDIAENPTLIAEVLSPSTESDDRGFKFARYRTIQSLRVYLLVSQTEPQIEMFTRQANGIPVAAIYENVAFEETSAT